MFEKRFFDMIKSKDEINEFDYYNIRKLRHTLYLHLLRHEEMEAEAGDKFSFKRLDIQGFFEYVYIHRLYTQSELDELENALEVSTEFLKNRKPIVEPTVDQNGNEVESDNYYVLLRTNFLKLSLLKINEQRYMPKDMFEYNILPFERYETQFKQDYKMNKFALSLVKSDRDLVNNSTIYDPARKQIILEALDKKINQLEENNRFCKNKLDEIKEDNEKENDR